MTRRSRHSSAIPSMLHQSGTPPRPQSETCLRPAANACAIWYQQAPTQDHANLDCDQSSGRIRQFLEGRRGISRVLVARPHRFGFRKQPSAALLPWQWVPASASRGPPSSTGPVRCDLRSSEIGCHGLGGLAATLVKRSYRDHRGPDPSSSTSHDATGRGSSFPGTAEAITSLATIYTLSNSI